MKNQIILFFLSFLINSNSQAGELIFGWNLVNPSGKIYDMQFMPDNDYFVLCTATDIQIRSSETGELVQTYPFGGLRFEFTPDSIRIILIPTGGETGRLQLRNIIDWSLIKEYVIPPDSEGFNVSFSELKVDPIRPYVYVIKSRTKLLDKYYHFKKIEIYNYETMEFIGELTSEEDEDFYLQYLAVSNDGKYLAEIDASYLRVWDLETRKKIRHFKLATYYPDGPSGSATCLKFSEKDTDNIYFSGSFPQSNSNKMEYNGLFIYNIIEHKIIDSTFGVEPKQVVSGYFTLFNNEEKGIIAHAGLLRIFNYSIREIELKLFIDSIDYKKRIGEKIIYSPTEKSFIGYSSENLSSFNYTSDVGVVIQDNNQKVVYPNPTDGLVNIKLDCISNDQSYEIYNINSLLIYARTELKPDENTIIIDLSRYPLGIYLLKYYCEKEIITYKIVKEN